MLFPARYTGTPDHWPTDGDMLIDFSEMFFRTAEGLPLLLDDWQKWLLRKVLTRFPEGHPMAGRLVYRQVVVSIPRQNGKSLLGAILGLYGLIFHYRESYVIGVASTKEQAQIIYQRVMAVIAQNPSLKRRFDRLTDTRGIANPDKTKKFELKASRGAALQGLPINLCLFDELHISKPEMWSAVVLGTTTFADGIVIGITTAGDESSLLLKDLYIKGSEALQGIHPRFGFFVWEAPSDAITEENILLSNPAVECGRVSLQDVLSDLAALPPAEVIRYRLNRFVASSNPWIGHEVWARCLGGPVDPYGAFLAIDRTPNWTNATFVAVNKHEEGYRGQIARSFQNPTQHNMYAAAKEYYKYNVTFVVDGYGMGPLAEDLKADGQRVVVLNGPEVVQACSRAYSMLQTGRLTHAGDELLTYQSLRATTKNIGNGWRIIRGSSDIDALLAFVFAAYAIDSKNNVERVQLW